MNKIEGLIAATYTPFDEQGNVNIGLIAPYADYLKKSGVRGVFVNGTTGEGPSLSREERLACAEAWVAQKSADFKVLIHVGHNSITESKMLAGQAEKIGADGIGTMATSFFKPGDISALVTYNEQIAAEAPALPYYYYHIPGMTGVHFPMIDFLQSAQERIPNLAGIKYSHGDLMDMKLCLEYADRQFEVLHGTDEILICGLALGVRGAIGSTYNYMAPLFVQLIQAFDRQDLVRADELQYKAIKIIHLLIKGGGAIKAGRSFMRHIGLEMGNPRLPVLGLNTSEEAQLFRELDALQFSDHCLKFSG